MCTAIKRNGFTLIELMIVVVLVGLLATVALPSYRQHVLRTQRTLAQGTLAELALRQEGFLADRKRYATTLTELGLAAERMYLQPGGALGTEAGGAIYRLQLDAAAGDPGYRLSALPEPAAAGDSACGTLTLDHLGIRTASGSLGSDCWRR